MCSKALCMISFLLVLASCNGNKKNTVREATTTKDTIPKKERLAGEMSVTSFIPDGFVFHDSIGGDLNLDTYRDIALVVKIPNEDTFSNSADTNLPRPLILLLGQPDGSYKPGGRCDKAVYCYSCGGMMGDPYVGIVIKKGFFSVEHYAGSAWRWQRIITFKYSPKDSGWYLHREGEVTFHAGDPEATQKEQSWTTKDFGKIRFEDYDIYNRD